MLSRTSLTGVAAGLCLNLSVAQADVMLGAFVPGNGWNPANIGQLNEDLNESLSYINVFSSFSADWDLLYWQSGHVHEAGMVPMISWMPVDMDRPNVNILPEITLGYWDDYLDNWGNKLEAWVNQYPADEKPSLMIRFGHEFNGNWYPWGDSPDWYKSAYQHIHDQFEEKGINEHIEWVWSASNTNVDSHDDMTVYYPGDDYVDWTSLDGYNWGSNYAWTQWESFSARFADSYLTLVNNYPEKPILIAEVASAEPLELPDPSWGQNGDDSDRFQDKDQWTYEMLGAIETEFPAIRALTLFNVNKELGWSLNSTDNSGLQGFTTGLMSEHYTKNFLHASQAGMANMSSDLMSLELREFETQLDSTTTKSKNSLKGNTRKTRDKQLSEKKKASQMKRKIEPEVQRELAASKRPAKGDQVRRKQMRDGFLNMSENARQHMKSWKLELSQDK